MAKNEDRAVMLSSDDRRIIRVALRRFRLEMDELNVQFPEINRFKIDEFAASTAAGKIGQF